MRVVGTWYVVLLYVYPVEWESNLLKSGEAGIDEKCSPIITDRIEKKKKSQMVSSCPVPNLDSRGRGEGWSCFTRVDYLN